MDNQYQQAGDAGDTAAFLHSIGLDDRRAGAHAELARRLQGQGLHAEAAAAWRTVLAVQPDDAEAHTFLGLALQASGDFAAAAASFREALALTPESAELWSNLGVVLQELGSSAEAAEALAASLRLDPRRPEAYLNLGAVRLAEGRAREAVGMFRKAIAIRPDLAIAHASLGVAEHQCGHLALAVTALRTAVAIAPDYAEAHANLGHALQSQGMLGEAVECFRQAIRLGMESPGLSCNLGVALQDLGAQAEAIAAYQQAIALAPAFANAHANLGVVLLEQERHDEAEAALRRALELEPANPKAHSNLGILLHQAGRGPEAEAAFRKAIAVDPSFADSYANLAVLLIHASRDAEALELLATSASLTQDHGAPLPEGSRMPPYRLKHDAEQIGWLRANGLLDAEWNAYADALQALRAEAAGAAGLSGESLARVAPSCNRLVHRSAAPALAKGALRDDLDAGAIESGYAGSVPEIAVMDDFLTEEALLSLRRFCNAATVWKEEYANGYLGATLKGGFAAPLILQVAEEIRARLPRIFGPHRLEQAWAFKYDSTMKGINVHADFAAVNVNFWITPDEACEDPERGGLLIWDKASPRDWSFREYNAGERQIRRFLAEADARAVRVPYRANRCVIFNSTLFHETDRFTFRDAYECRRINVTLLYGKGLRMR